MADVTDQASDLEELQRQQMLQNRPTYQGESREECLECGDTIPLPRREALPGVDLCFTCQTVEEHRARHGL